MKRILSSALLIIAVAGGYVYSATRAQSFPHERHQGLFPTCEGCHAGIYSGDESQVVSVQPGLCAGCHNGTVQVEVDWDGYMALADNLKFTHSGHPQLPCETCHRNPDFEGEMAVQEARPTSCMACHGGGQTEHLAAVVTCETCHVPVTGATGLTATQILLFPIPQSHGTDDFLAVHGGLATEDVNQCAVCHARESCTVCHLNADRVAPIQALGTDDRIAALVASKEGRWPTPSSHLGDEWIRIHGEMAEATPGQCSSCHAQQSCENCHAGGNMVVSSVIASLPRAAEGGPQGVQTASSMPSHGKDFVVVHQTAAATESGTCASCHTETFCSDCHDASMAPSFHAVNYVVQHSADAVSEFNECSSCHSSEVFCRDCHSNLGAGVVAGANGGYHDASTDWLLTHGRAARQGLETCTTCHQQTSCLRCHSAKAGWRVNPHGPDFDPSRVAERSQISCGICHFGFQTEGG